MLNLLIISNASAAQVIREGVQPLIRARIDVVADFDHGLKDVFEKRPATVIIQDQISGVTGESVARHIQLLLGNGAPKYILIHEGNSKVRPIPGLFDYVINLNQDASALVRETVTAMRRIYGDEWGKIVVEQIPPAPQEGPLEDADRQMGDENIPEVSALGPEPEVGESVFAIDSNADEQKRKTDQHVPRSPKVELELPPVPPVQPLPNGAAPLAVPGVAQPIPATGVNDKAARPARRRTVPDNSAPQPDRLPDDILNAFEENYRTRSRKTIVGIVALLTVIILAGIYLLRDHLPRRFFFQPSVTQSPPAGTRKSQGIEPKTSVPPAVPQGSVSSASKPSSITESPLPSFIPVKGRDTTFSARKPGWDRYVNARHDVRIFRRLGKIKAVQVIAKPEQVISDQFLKSALTEITGIASYSPGAQQQQRGYVVQSSRIGGHADLLVYYRDGSKAIIAFVVSLD